MDDAREAREDGAFPGDAPNGDGTAGGKDGRTQTIGHSLLSIEVSLVEYQCTGKFTHPPLSKGEESLVLTAVKESCGQNEDLEKGRTVGADVDTPLSYHPRDANHQALCRICYMSTTMDNAISLGCACAMDLARAHRTCADRWFRLKGNRDCEICRETAANVIMLPELPATQAICRDRENQFNHENGETQVNYHNRDAHAHFGCCQCAGWQACGVPPWGLPCVICCLFRNGY